LILVPGLVEPPVDVKRAPVDRAQQDIERADEELAVREAHRRAAGTAAARLHEHHRAAPSGAQAGKG
jgi:hypothetical protein